MDEKLQKMMVEHQIQQTTILSMMFCAVASKCDKVFQDAATEIFKSSEMLCQETEALLGDDHLKKYETT